jgi:ketosteroid isomerase-like protein
MDPDIEYVNPPYAVEPGTRRGYRGFATAAEAIHTVYPTRRFEPLAFYDAGDRVAVRVRVIARGVGSSVEVDAERGYVFDVRDGKIVRFAWFNEPLEALEAAGLAARHTSWSLRRAPDRGTITGTSADGYSHEPSSVLG